MPQGIYPHKSLPCKVDGCGGKRSQSGYCGTHAWRVKHWGHPGVDVPIASPSLTIEERFWPKVNKNGPVSETRPDLGQCWLWTASLKDGGYGQMQYEGRLVAAHRIAYLLLVGPIPEGYELDHLCRVHACVRPTHVEPVTHRENLLRGDSPMAKQARRTHCIYGHEFTPENTGRVKRKSGFFSRRCLECQRLRNRGIHPTQT